MRIAPLTLALLVVATGPAAAADRPAFAAHMPQATAAEAFAGPYGQAIVREMIDILEKSGDAGCRASKSLTADKLAKAGEAILVKYGQRMIDRAHGLIDAKATDAHFARATAGTGLGELRALARDPLVVELLALQRPGALDRMVDLAADMFDRYVLLNGIAVAGYVSPIASGSDLMQLSRDEESSEAAGQLIDDNKDSPGLKRYLELFDAALEAMDAATDHEANLKVGPSQEYAGLDADLQALCIGPR